MNILVVEDDELMADVLVHGLREESYNVARAADGRAALRQTGDTTFDLILLDVMLPGMNGLQVARQLRLRGNTVPVLMLTARDAPPEIVTGLDAGADDYLTKPFDLGELIARAKALIRRGKGIPAPIIEVGRLSVNSIEQTIRCDGKIIELSPTEYRILEYLMFRPLVIVSKRQILEHLYDFTWEHHSNVIEAHMSNLRKKLRAAGVEDTVQTIRGSGYRLAKPEDSI